MTKYIFSKINIGLHFRIGIFAFFLAINASGQVKFDCDSLLNFLCQKRNYGEQFDKVVDFINFSELKICVLDDKNRTKINIEFIFSLEKLFWKINDKEERGKIILMMIELQPYLNENLKYTNKQVLLSLGFSFYFLPVEEEYLKKIKQYFNWEDYHRWLFFNAKKLSEEQKIEVESVFYQNNEGADFEQKKWLTALLLAKENHQAAEDYLLETANKLVKGKYERLKISDFGMDFVMTQNARLINYIVDEFLMSDYSWVDYDWGHNDYTSAYSILMAFIDAPVLEPGFEYYDRKEEVRQWFKLNRNAYKFNSSWKYKE